MSHNLLHFLISSTVIETKNVQQYQTQEFVQATNVQQYQPQEFVQATNEITENH